MLEQLNNLVRSEAQQRFQQLVAAATEQLSFVTNSFETLDRMVVEKAAQLTPEMAKENESLQKSRSSIAAF